jgi:hypothetical protein
MGGPPLRVINVVTSTTVTVFGGSFDVVVYDAVAQYTSYTVIALFTSIVSRVFEQADSTQLLRKVDTPDCKSAWQKQAL